MSDIPYLVRKSQHRIGKAGRASEKRLARQLGGRATPVSGAMQGAKGDIAFGEVLMEAKSTTNLSMALKHSWLDKIAREARAVAKTPTLAVSFIKEDGQPITDGEWVLIPRHKFEEML